MKPARTRIAALMVMAVIGVLVLAACGSSSTSSSSSAAAGAAGGAGAAGAAGGGPGGGPGGAGNSAARAKLTACLKQHGVTLPTRPAGARTGTTGGSGAPPGGGYGGGGGGQRRGFFSGGAGGARGRFNNPKFQAAFKACGGAAGFRGGAGGAGRFRPTQAAITKFAACAKQHGYTLPKANLTGKGPIYPTTIEKNAKFQAAAKACQSLLRPAGGGAPPGGAPPAGGSSTTSGT